MRPSVTRVYLRSDPVRRGPHLNDGKNGRAAPFAYDDSSMSTLHNRHTGERLALRRVVRDGQIWLELKGSLPPHQDGPPLHVHYAETEEGQVVAGTLSAVVDGQRIQVRAGETTAFPAGSVHRWWNDGDDTLVFEGFVKSVVDLDVYLEAVFDVLNSVPSKRPPLFYMAHVAWRHRRTQALRVGPAWILRIALPAIVLVGTMLGRYRGTNWPGCPDRSREPSLASAGSQ
jgi:mannose-6-phosphate isomerase-like protein (cupin superfamily)